MKYFFRLLLIVVASYGLSACTEALVSEEPASDEMPVKIYFCMAQKSVQTKSMVKGEENVVQTMQLVCFDANGQYLGIRKATVMSSGPTDDGVYPPYFDQGIIKGTVPEGTARIHFIANRNLSIPLSFSNGTSEETVMLSEELSTLYSDNQEVCYWGYHKEANARAMNTWLNPTTPGSSIVYMIRDRAKVVLRYDPTGEAPTVTKIDWLIHGGRDRGYLAPAPASWESYYGDSIVEDPETQEEHTYKISKAGMNQYEGSGRYSLWTSAEENEDDHFDVAYQSSGTYDPKNQFLFDDINADTDLKVILKVSYEGYSDPVYHVLRLKKNDTSTQVGERYPIVRNNTYYISCSQLKPNVASYPTLEEAVKGTEYMNADVEIDRSITQVDNENYTLQILLPTETTSIVLNTPGEHTMDFAFRLADDVETTPEGTTKDSFEVKWENTQSFCSSTLDVNYNSTTNQFTITATVLEGQITEHLQDEWIIVKHKASGLTRYIHVFVIDQFRYLKNPKLTKVSETEYVLSLQIPPAKAPEDNPTAAVYPESLYPIDIKFTTNTLNAYGITSGNEEYGLFGVSVESTAELVTAENFEDSFNSPVSSTNTDDISHWYFQQGGKFWDFWYTYSLKTYPINGEGTEDDGVVNIYFKDVRDHIKYVPQNQNNGKVRDVGLFLYVKYFGKYYSIPVTVTNP